MPISLKPSDKSALLLAFSQLTGSAKVTTIFGAYFDNEAWLRNLEDQLDEKTLAALNRHLEKDGLANFFRAEILRDFFDKGHKLDPKSISLTTYEGFAHPYSVADTLVSRLQALPFDYRLSVRASKPLSKAFQGTKVNIKLSKRLWLVTGSELPAPFPLSTNNQELDNWIFGRKVPEGKQLAVSHDDLYFVYRGSGYVGEHRETQVHGDFLDDIRAFYGACLATNILDQFPSFFSDEYGKPFVGTHLLGADGSAELVRADLLDTDLLRAGSFDTSSATDALVKKGTAPEAIFSPIVSMFGTKDSVKLSTAAVWILRAHLSSRGMDTVLEATIAMEVLLGDREASDRVGLSKLMANRCAYALGQTAEERKSILDFFVEFYTVRSEIVHRGRFRISPSERKVVDRGLALAERLLRHEIEIGSAAGAKS